MWIFLTRLLSRGLSFVRTLILARLLSPVDFGVMGIALIILSALDAFTQTGFKTALIQKTQETETYLDTAWTVSVFRGILLFTALFLSAPFAALFFRSPQAESVIRVIACTVLLAGFENVGTLYFQKDLEFSKQSILILTGALVGLFTTVTLAFILRNVWALVWGSIATSCSRLFLSYALHSYRPKFKFHHQQFKELLSFGQWIFASSVLAFLVTQGDDILVGRILGVAALGLYQMAYLISNLPTTEVSHVVSNVTFPAYARLQDRPEKLGEAYLKVLKLTVCLTAPIAGGIFTLASEFTDLVLGPKWLPIVTPLKVLVVAGFIRSVAATTVPVFHGMGRPRIDSGGQGIRLFVLALLVYPLIIRYHLPGASMAVLGSISICSVYFIFWILRITRCPARSFFNVLFFPVINTLIMILILSFIKQLFSMTHLLHLCMTVILGIALYVAVSMCIDRFYDYKLYTLIKDIAVSK